MTLEQNIFLAKRNLVDTIWKSANLEGVNVTFPETQMIIDGFSVANKTIEELTIILNLKRAWEFLFASITDKINLSSIQDFNRIVGRDLIHRAGFLRTANVRIGGTNYKPKLPVIYEVEKEINKILENQDQKDMAINLMLYIMRAQLFFDGNKRTAMLSANKILIQNGLGILAVSQKHTNEFFTKLIGFYETNNNSEIKAFCIENCIEVVEFEDEELEETAEQTQPTSTFSKFKQNLANINQSLENNKNAILNEDFSKEKLENLTQKQDKENQQENTKKIENNNSSLNNTNLNNENLNSNEILNTKTHKKRKHR